MGDDAEHAVARDDGALGFAASELLAGQQLLAFLGDAPRMRDVARDGAHSDDPLAARVADHEVRVETGSFACVDTF